MAAKAGVFISVVGQADPRGFAKARAELKALEAEARRTGSGMEAALARGSSKLKGIGSNMMALGRRMTVGVTLPIVGGLGLAAKAAAEEERAMELLEGSLRKNVGATDKQVAAVERFITKTQNATGVLDDELRPAFAKLLIGGRSIEQAQRDLGIALDIAAARGKPLSTVIEAMSKAAQGQTGALGRLGIATKNAAGETLTYDEILAKASETMGGQAARAARTASGRWSIMRAKFDDLVESIGSKLLPVGERLIGWVGRAIDGFSGLPGWVQSGAVIFAVLAAAIGPIVTVLGAFATAIGAILSPVGLVIAAIIAFVAAVVLLWKHWDTVWSAIRDHPALAVIVAILAWPIAAIVALVGAAKWLYENWDQVWSDVQDAIEAVRPVIDAVVGFVGGQLDKLGEWASENGALFSDAWDNISTAVRVAVGVVAGLLRWLVQSVLLPAFQWWARFAVPLLRAAWELIKSIIDAALQVIRGVIQTVLAIIAGDWGKAWDGIKMIVGAVWDAIVAVIRFAWTYIVTIISAALSLVVNVLSAGWNAATGVVRGAIETIGGFIASLPGRIAGIAGAVLSASVGIGRAIIDGIGQGLSAVGGFVADLGEAVISAFKRAANWVIDRINDAIPNSIGAGFFSIDLPDNPIPRLHDGGVFRAPRGRREGFALLEDGERVLTRAQDRAYQLVMGAVGGRAAPAAVGAGSGPIRIDVHVDARGTANPAEIEAAARRGAETGARTALRELTRLKRAG